MLYYVFMIERNVPIPPLGRNKDYGDMPKMQVGDSIVVAKEISWAIRAAMFRLGWRVATRTVDKDNRRLWRIA